MKTLDCRNLQCPQPVIQVRQQMQADPTASFSVLVNDPVSRDNICRLAGNQGYGTDVRDDAEEIRIDLVPGDGPLHAAGKAATGPTVVLVGSDEMGHGDPKLGQILMKNFVFTLTESDITPDKILFVNAGVKLTVGGSDLLEPLEQLANSGSDIASCGLCLEFFGLKEALAVGRITNMLEIVNTLEGAGRIIRP